MNFKQNRHCCFPEEWEMECNCRCCQDRNRYFEDYDYDDFDYNYQNDYNYDNNYNNIHYGCWQQDCCKSAENENPCCA